LVRTVVFTQLASIPFMLTLSYSYILSLSVLAFIFRGGLMNLGVPIVTNLAMELSDRDEQGLVNALLMVSWTGSWMVSAALGGQLIESYGYTVAMNITIILYVLSSIMFYGFFRKTEARSREESGWVILRGEVH
jgi:predicted MFS family arabinose efflux permease